LIDHLNQYREALKTADSDRMCELLKEGTERKEIVDRKGDEP